MPILTSAMAAAIDALVGLAGLELSDTEVVDGPLDDSDETSQTIKQRLFVGASSATGDDESVAVDGDQNFRTIGGRRRDENFNLHCIAEGWDGGRDMKAARDRAVAVLAGVELILRPSASNPAGYTVGGSVMWAGIGHEEMTQDKNETGYYCRIDFEIACRANLIQTS